MKFVLLILLTDSQCSRSSSVVYAFEIMSIRGYRKFRVSLEAIDRRVMSRRRLITHDDTLVHEAKIVFRYLLATVIRRLQNVRGDA